MPLLGLFWPFSAGFKWYAFVLSRFSLLRRFYGEPILWHIFTWIQLLNKWGYQDSFSISPYGAYGLLKFLGTGAKPSVIVEHWRSWPTIPCRNFSHSTDRAQRTRTRDKGLPSFWFSLSEIFRLRSEISQGLHGAPSWSAADIIS